MNYAILHSNIAWMKLETLFAHDFAFLEISQNLHYNYKRTILIDHIIQITEEEFDISKERIEANKNIYRKKH
ncbi:unnamed protein product [Dracunculus medinensis]|uniref:IstB_IS21 domain-containing protein n=1 Tax=Dracunculus medinensis TaxID=318479 RepID=A0A0N4UM91_DRAME|nr:unnamed protein product [Dracunculus medinensis]